VYETMIREFNDTQTVDLSLSDLENGVYFASVFQNGEARIKRISLVK